MNSRYLGCSVRPVSNRFEKRVGNPKRVRNTVREICQTHNHNKGVPELHRSIHKYAQGVPNSAVMLNIFRAINLVTAINLM